MARTGGSILSRARRVLDLRRGIRAAGAALLTALAACAEPGGINAPEPFEPGGPRALLVSGANSYTQVSAGALHTCAIGVGGRVTCWGSNFLGQSTPSEQAESGVTQVSAGFFHTCAVRAGAVLCWGRNTYGESTVPAAAQNGISQVSAGEIHTCALTTGGAVICWGTNTSYNLTVVPAAAQSGVTQISAGPLNTCAVGTGGAVICWGYDATQQLNVPAAAQSGVRAVSVGAYHICAVKTSGAVVCWGENYQGESTVPAAAQSGVSGIGAGFQHTCAVGSGGAVICWGPAYLGRTDVPPTAQSGMTQVASGAHHSCALSALGGIICWGDNAEGQVTVPATSTRVSPSATFGAPATVLAGQSVVLSLTDAQVPGYPQATTFTYAFDCGTGTYGAASSSNTATCASSVVGALTVRGKVIDQDNDVAEYSASVTIIPVDGVTVPLRDEVEAADVQTGVEQGLLNKLDAAAAALVRGNTTAACNLLAAFQQQVQAQRGKAIPSTTADEWLAHASQLRASIGC